jgi:hypothetical protein
MGPTAYETLFGGSEFEVLIADHARKEIRPQVVKVRQIPVEDFQKAIHCLTVDDDNALIELVCQQSPGWTLTLTPQSFLVLVEEIKRVNADFFASATEKVQARWNWIAAMPPESLEKMAKANRSLNASPTSRQHPA